MQSEGPCNLSKSLNQIQKRSGISEWPIAEGIACNWGQQVFNKESTTGATTVATCTMKIAPWNMKGFNEPESLLQRHGIGLMGIKDENEARNT